MRITSPHPDTPESTDTMTVTTSSTTLLDALLTAAQALSTSEQLAFVAMLMRHASERDAAPRPVRVHSVDQDPSPRRSRTRLGAPTRTAAERQALYASSVWRSAYRPGAEMHVYILGCPGLEHRARQLGEPLFKVGTARMGRFQERVAELNREHYGSLVRAPEGTHYVSELGFDAWAPPRKLQLGMPHALGPVRAATATFIVRLPDHLSPGRFEADLNMALRSASLRGFVDGDEGRAVLQQRGLSPDAYLRATLDRRTGLPAAAMELMLIRPQADGPKVGALIEDIVIDRVLGLPARIAA